jgi:uncharacterized membrane protein
VSRSGAGGFVAAGLMALSGVGGAVALVAYAVLSIPDPARFRAPGAGSFEAAEPGRYVLWHEYRSFFENRSWKRDPRLPDGVRFRVLAPSGAELALDRSGSGSWKVGDTERQAIAGVVVREPGRHAVIVEGAMEPAVIAVGRDFLWRTIACIAAAVIVALLGVGGGLALALWTFAKRVEGTPPAAAPPGAAFDAPPHDPTKALRELATVVYALQAASFLFGITLVAGVVINYLKRADAAGTWLESHFEWQIRTFWWTLAWCAIGLLTSVILVGFVVLAAAAIWFIYRIAKGCIALSEHRPAG